MLLTLGVVAASPAATITVTNAADSGSGSLRAAIAAAQNGDTINFDPGLNGNTITLTSAGLAISANLTVSGPGAAQLTISGGNSTTVGTIFTINSGVTVTISGLTITGGNASSTDTGGGGILNSGTLTVAGCAIMHNSAASSIKNQGGGIANYGTLNLNNSTVSGNNAADGAGLFNGGGNTLTVVNSTFYGNNTTASGGGIYNSASGIATLTNSTIYSNNATSNGGGIYNSSSGTLTVTNSIVASNTAASSDDIDGSITTNGGGNTISPGTTINLAPLATYGGPTPTLLPLPGSPAICAGNKAGAPTTDQRGFTTGAAAYCSSGKVDSGAVQTNYTAVSFTNKGASGYVGQINNPVSFPVNPIVSVTENGLNQGGVPVTLTLNNGSGTATGLGPVNTVSGTGATFTNIQVPASDVGSDTLDVLVIPTTGATPLTDSAALKIISITLMPSAGALAGATQGANYTVAFTASGGSTSLYTYKLLVTSGTMPGGLSFTAATATLAGTANAAGTVGFTITATDGNSFSGSQSYTLTVNPPVKATTVIASKALTVSQSAVNFTPVTGSGGTPPLSYSVSPSLPGGLTLSSSTGEVTGVPTAVSLQTTYTVTVTDANGQAATANFVLTVNKAVTATTVFPATTLTVNQPSASFTPVTSSGGTAPYSYTVAPSLPAGLSIGHSAGIISGIPTAASTQTSYTVTVTDNNGSTASSNFSLTVNAAVMATLNTPIITLTAGQPSVTLLPVSGSGGTGTLTYSIMPNVPPANLNFNPASGAITGQPMTSSTATMYTVKVTDTNGANASQAFTLTVNAALTPTQAVPDSTLSVNLSVTPFTPVTTTGGTPPLKFVVSPLLPSGLSYSMSSGTVSGTPLAASVQTTYNVTITDSNQVTVTSSFSLKVNPASTSVTVNSSSTNNSSTVNNAVTFTARVTPFSGNNPLSPPYTGVATVTGSVSFIDTGSDNVPHTLCADSAIQVVNGTYMATCSTSTLTAQFSPHKITAAYQGNSNYTTSKSTVTQTVMKASSSTTLTSTLLNPQGPALPANTSIVINPKDYNDQVTFTAAVTPNSPVALSQGTVTFTDTVTIDNTTKTNPLCSAVAPSNAVATCSTRLTVGGQHTITATYSADPNYLQSQGTAPQAVQDFRLTAQGEAFVTQGYTTGSDPLHSAAVTVTSLSMEQFATAATAPLGLTCMSSQAGAPNCTLSSQSLAVTGSATEPSVSVAIDATGAGVKGGIYTFVVTGTDSTTGLSHTAQFSADVRPLGSPNLGVPSGASVMTSVDFATSAALSGFECIGVSGPNNVACQIAGATGTSSGPTFTLQFASGPQTSPVSVTINTGPVATSQLERDTNASLAGLLGVPAIAALGLLGRRLQKGRRFLRFLALAFVVFLAVQGTGCGGSFTPANTSTGKFPAGTYLIGVQASDSANNRYQSVIQINVIR
ncbi:MAG: Ig-like domain repeat protein [Silvibacterium sp.]|nr:Ig-like domain repeat protein [Silvibacterium sp.]